MKTKFSKFPGFSFQWSVKTAFGIFEILKIEIFRFFFSFLLAWDHVGVKISKRYSYKSQPNVLRFF